MCAKTLCSTNTDTALVHRVESVVRSCAAGSTALRGLACAGSVTADGFAAEYWCADPATMYNDGPALRAAFRAAAGGGWGGKLRGWGAGDNPCGGGRSSWEGVTCGGGSGRVTEVDLDSRSELGGFELGPSVGNLTALTQLNLCESVNRFSLWNFRTAGTCWNFGLLFFISFSLCVLNVFSLLITKHPPPPPPRPKILFDQFEQVSRGRFQMHSATSPG